MTFATSSSFVVIMKRILLVILTATLCNESQKPETENKLYLSQWNSHQHYGGKNGCWFQFF